MTFKVRRARESGLYLLPALMALASFPLAASDTSPRTAAYPAKPIRLIVPSPPGGGNDLVARLIGRKLADSMGQQIVVDNRGGAGGMLGYEIAARAQPDGYTLLLGDERLVVAGHDSKLPFAPARVYVPLALIATASLVLVVHPGVPASSAADLISLARATPGALNYASTSAGANHLAAELFKRMAKVDITHVSYKGVAQAINDVIAGHVQIMFANTLLSVPNVKAERLRALAVTGPRRVQQLPSVPTLTESALPGYETQTWWGFFAPAGTPPAILRRLEAEISRARASADVQERLSSAGATVSRTTTREFERYVVAENRKWAKLIREVGLRID